MIKIKVFSIDSINKAFSSLWCKICSLAGRVTTLEENGGGTGIQSLSQGFNMEVDNTDPLNPILSSRQNIEYVQELTDIVTIDGTDVDSILVGNEFTGGEFIKYSGAYVADGGVVLTDANGQKWKRIVDDYIDIRWFGAEAVTLQQIDSHSAILATITASESLEIIESPVIFIPSSGASNKWYYSSGAINFTKRTKVYGDHALWSHIRFAAGLTNSVTTTYNTSRGSIFNDFTISAFGSAVTGTAGFKPNDIVYSNNLTIKEFWDGLSLTAAIPTGNVNNSIFSNLHLSQNRRHGAYIAGPDANNITLYNLDAVSNGGLGVNDESFLGNHYYTIHFATNCSPTLTWQKGLVRSGGLVYVSIRDNNIGVEPNVTVGWENWWFTNGTIQAWSPTFDVNIPLWAVGNTYHAGGSINLNGSALPPIGAGQNQWGSITNSYMEEDQPPAYIGNRCTSLGGNMYYRGLTAELQAINNTFYTPALKIGGPVDNSTDVVVKFGGTTSGATRGIGVTTINPNGIWLDYFPGTAAFGQSMGAMKIQGGSSAVRFLTAGTTPTTSGRTNTPSAQANLALTGPMYFSFTANRTILRELDFSTGQNGIYSASTTTKDEGDMLLLSRDNIFTKADYIMAKVIAPVTTGTKKWVGVKGFEEQLITQVAAGIYVIGRDYNLVEGRGILYDITFTGTSGTDNCVIQRRALCKLTAGVMSTINNQEIGTSLKDTTFATTDINFNLFTGSGNNDVELQIINLPANTNGKVNVKRIDY